MRESRISARNPKVFRIKATDSNFDLLITTDLVQRDFSPNTEPDMGLPTSPTSKSKGVRLSDHIHGSRKPGNRRGICPIGQMGGKGI